MAPDTRQASDEIEVTPEMIEAGSKLIWEHELPPSEEEMSVLVAEVFRAMWLARSKHQPE